MDDADVQTVFQDYVGLVEGVVSRDPSGLTALERTYPKVLLLASASYLETATCSQIQTLYSNFEPTSLATFVFKGALERKFHSLFDWNAPTAGKLFSFFGPECATRYKEALKTDDALKERTSAFMRIGSLRNQLVHQNYASFSLDLTTRDIIKLHDLAKDFPGDIEDIISAAPPTAG